MSSEPPPPEPPTTPHPSSPPSGPRHRFGLERKPRGFVLAAIVVLVALVAVVAVAVRHHPADVLASQRPGDIFLQATDRAGPDPYTPSVAHPGPAVTAPTQTSTPTPPDGAPAGAVVIEAPSGSTPALYGGTDNQSACDPQALVVDLQSHPDLANAWVTALNPDTSLQWSGGSQLGVGQISPYVAELTPVRLRTDTRVTNHGFASGKDTPFQAVLQAGTAVLVDALGVPRARCASGNPLTAPVAVTVAPTYTGDPPWTGFSPTSVTAVSPAPSPISTFVLADLDHPNQTLSLPAGGRLPQPVTPSPSATPSPTTRSSPSPTPTPSRSPSPSAPPITLTPNSGPSSGGTQVRVSGRGFTSGGGVQAMVFYTTQGFLAAQVASFSVDSDSVITLTTGPATSNGGCNTLGCVTFLSIQFANGSAISVSNAFRFIVTPGGPSPSETSSSTPAPSTSPSPSPSPAPSRSPSGPDFAVTSMTPSAGPAGGGTAVTIKGYGFKSHGGVTLVDFHNAGGYVADSPSTVQLVSDTEITLMTNPVSPSNCGASCTTTLYIQFSDGTGFSSLTFTFQ